MQLYINRKFYRFICAWYKRPSSFGVATPRALTVFADFECTNIGPKTYAQKFHKCSESYVSHIISTVWSFASLCMSTMKGKWDRLPSKCRKDKGRTDHHWTCTALAWRNGIWSTKGRHVHSNILRPRGICLLNSSENTLRREDDEFKTKSLLTFIHRGTWSFLCVKTNLCKVFSFQQIVMPIFTFRPMLAVRQVEKSTRGRFIYTY